MIYKYINTYREETLIEVDLTRIQKLYYKLVYEKNMDVLMHATKGGKTLRNISMDLRKVCNHPFLLEGVEEILTEGMSQKDILDSLISSCGKMILLDKLLTKLYAEKRRVLIFSQMTRVLDLLEDYLHYKFPFAGYERIDGGIKGV